MTRPAIIVDGIGKQYKIGARERATRNLREAIADAVTAPIRRFRALREKASADELFWALKDVSFEVQRGEVLGIIGRNGAGKSTLLNILSRITEPTTGRAIVRGAVGSLLEVGTGFHPELTGRENVYLNGAILGMKRAEINRKFDEIVSFAEVERFLDTPVKRYSSGMYVRLAFAVAAHLDPEILLVDEVLAVGDVAFREKCMGKMEDVAKRGRTVLLVSHQMAALDALCSRCILLNEGTLVMVGEPSAVIAHYLEADARSGSEVDLAGHPGRARGMTPVACRFRIADNTGRPLKNIPLGSEARFEVDIVPNRQVRRLGVAIQVHNSIGRRIVTYHTKYQCPDALSADGPSTVTCSVPSCIIVPGSYSLVLSIYSGHEEIDRVEHFASFEVAPRDLYGTGKVPTSRDGIYVPEATWRIDPSPVTPGMRKTAMGERK